ncbi:EamA family transporter, partial [Streptomyces sp. McG5]|nr:EamA family transporter [Streptomyces sp. McG5]
MSGQGTDAAAAKAVAAGAAVSTPEAAGAVGVKRRRGAGGRGSLGPVGLVLAGGLSVQFGGALAVTLMPKAGALGVVSIRLAVAALVMMAVCRPSVRGYTRADWGTVLAFGTAMAGMNALFYQSVDRIPLGPAVTLEVLGPLALSVLA